MLDHDEKKLELANAQLWLSRERPSILIKPLQALISTNDYRFQPTPRRTISTVVDLLIR